MIAFFEAIAAFGVIEVLLALGLMVSALVCLFDRHLVRACYFLWSLRLQ